MKNYFLLLLLTFSTLTYGQNYIKIIKPDIHIRMSPSTSSPIVAHAFDGEIYMTNGENSRWNR